MVVTFLSRRIVDDWVVVADSFVAVAFPRSSMVELFLFSTFLLLLSKSLFLYKKEETICKSEGAVGDLVLKTRKNVK